MRSETCWYGYNVGHHINQENTRLPEQFVICIFELQEDPLTQGLITNTTVQPSHYVWIQTIHQCL